MQILFYSDYGVKHIACCRVLMFKVVGNI